MPTDHRAKLKKIKRIDQLIAYLRDEMGWPIETDDFEEITFEYTPEELGIDVKNAAKIDEIKRLRPLSTRQPWAIFFVKFEPKRLPVVALRRILGQLVFKKRASANRSERPSWDMNDLLFVSNYGEGADRRISFAHFTEDKEMGNLATLQVLGWDGEDTGLHLDDCADKLTNNLAWPDDEDDVDAWRKEWRSAFTLRHREVITTSKALAVRLADLARGIRLKVNAALEIETDKGKLRQMMKAFQEALIHDLDEDGFADMYAQTIAYGLLSARVSRQSGALVADDAALIIPGTNPFLKELMETFLNIGGRKRESDGSSLDFDELGINEVVETLRHANMEAVLRDFGDRNPQEDPVIHFYELFLKEYDAKKRMQRGVFYTPRPVVSYIVRSVDDLLRTEFGLEDGLADTATWGEMTKRNKDINIPGGVDSDQAFVQVLDPATGTGTFLVEVIDIIHKTMTAKWSKKGHGAKKIKDLWNEYTPRHLLPRLHGYELLMAPYSIAHLKIGLKLFETGYRFENDERARVFMTNALEPACDYTDSFAFIIPALAHEAKAVNEIKDNKRFTVLIGNPPYANRGMMNRNDWILGLLEEYKINLKEKKLNLDDDFIKFIRFGQHLLVTTGCGIYSLISSNTYLDGVTHRRMRESLLECFPLIRILDLHGNSQKKETCPDGSIDDNVFDIRQGVSIGTLVRPSGKKKKNEIFYHQLWGRRDSKYRALMASSHRKQLWSPIKPEKDYFFFVPMSLDKTAEYDNFVKISDIFLNCNNGFVTDRDKLFIDFNPSQLTARMRNLFAGKWSSKFIEQYRVVASSSYDIIKRISGKSFSQKNIIRCSYRPFDNRFVYYNPKITSRPAYDVMRHMDGRNVGLVLARLIVRSGPFDACFVSRQITEKKCGDSTRSSYLLPLYLTDSIVGKRPDLFNDAHGVNLNSKFTRAITNELGLDFIKNGHGNLKTTVGPEDVLDYIYAILHSPHYRERYAELLKIDFPCVPLDVHLSLFQALASFGDNLVGLHLLESSLFDRSFTSYHGPQEPEVSRIGWLDDTVWIDAAGVKKGRATKPGRIGFHGVSEKVWGFHIGGYHICHKWLKDRKGRRLSKDDINHYQKIIVAISETIRIMKEVDEVIDKHGGWPGAFQTKK